MSFTVATPELMVVAATDLEGIGSELRAANAVAAPATTGVAAAGYDEVSTAMASLFSGHAQAYQGLSVQLAKFYQQFVQSLKRAASLYEAAERAQAALLQIEQQFEDQTSPPGG